MNCACSRDHRALLVTDANGIINFANQPLCGMPGRPERDIIGSGVAMARAGEAGTGFAVVADEVRKLAEKTMGATREVGEVISLIQQGTGDAVAEMAGTRERVVKTASMAEEAGSVQQNIVSQADSIAGMVQRIATAAEQQSSTSDEINAGVLQINTVSKHIAGGIQEANAAIAEVSSMSQRLAKLVEEFSA